MGSWLGLTSLILVTPVSTEINSIFFRPDVVFLIFSFSFIFLIKTKNKIHDLKLIKYFIFLLIFWSFYVYAPIFLETYLNFDFNGKEEIYISNNRRSHMLGFLVPIISFPIIHLSVKKINYDQFSIESFFVITLIFTNIVIFFSLLRFFFDFELYQQSYKEIGSWLSGITNPDSNGFARMLLFPAALSISAYFNFKKFKFFWIISFIIIYFSIFFTGSRSGMVSLWTIILWTIFFKSKSKLRTSILFFLISIVIFVFFWELQEILLPRDLYTFGSSGRFVIYKHVLEILSQSPIVGLRPGGWIEYLSQDNIYSDGTLLKVQSAHSFYFAISLDWGLPLTILIFLLISYVIFKLTILNLNKKLISPSIKAISTALSSTLVSLLVLGLVEIVPIFFLYMILSLSVVIISKELKNEN